MDCFDLRHCRRTGLQRRQRTHSATGAAPPGVGTWVYVGNNFAATIAKNVRVYLVAQGIPEADAVAIAAELVEANSFLEIPTVTIRSDGNIHHGRSGA